MSNKQNQKLRNQTLYLMDGIKSVQVIFPSGGRQYTYLALSDLSLEKDDLVLVPDANEPNSYKTARVQSWSDIPEIDEESDIEYKFIVQKVDVSGHEAVLNKVDKAVSEFAKARHKAKRASYRAAVISQSGGDDSLLSLLELEE